MPTGDPSIIEKCSNCRSWLPLNRDRVRGECGQQRASGRTEFETPTGEFVVTYTETRVETVPDAVCSKHEFTVEAAAARHGRPMTKRAIADAERAMRSATERLPE